MTFSTRTHINIPPSIKSVNVPPRVSQTHLEWTNHYGTTQLKKLWNFNINIYKFKIWNIIFENNHSVWSIIKDSYLKFSTYNVITYEDYIYKMLTLKEETVLMTALTLQPYHKPAVHSILYNIMWWFIHMCQKIYSCLMLVKSIISKNNFVLPL